MIVIELKLSEIKQHWKIECPEVSLEFFMEQYCNQLSGKTFKRVEVIVSPTFKFIFDTST